MSILNGDWQDTSCIQYFLTAPGALQDRSQISKAVTSALIQVFASSKLPFHPKHRWTGADAAIDWIAGLEYVHGLFIPVFKTFLALSRKATSQAAAESAPSSSAPHASAEVVAGQEDDDISFAAAANRGRTLAQEWIDTSPFTRLFILRTCMERLLVYMNGQFQVNSPEFELMEEHQVVQASMGGEEAVAPRHFKLTVATFQKLEQRCVGGLMSLFSATPTWSMLPEHSRTIEISSGMLSRKVCMVRELLRHPHSLYPFSVFRVLHEPHLADVLSPFCLKDPWSQRMVEEFADWSSPAFKHVLLVHCLSCATDTSQIEARHASVRRSVVGRSVQVKKMSFEALGAHWIFQQMRRWKWVCGQKTLTSGRSQVGVGSPLCNHQPKLPIVLRRSHLTS